jgi:hypothetical protein
MPFTLRAFGTLTLALAFASGCGAVSQPRVRGVADTPLWERTGARGIPRPDTARGISDDFRPAVDRVCRSEGMRSGWIATAYVKGGDACLDARNPDKPYTAAVIERYSNRLVGATMVVCADQAVPRQWMREAVRDEGRTCEGARVGEGAPSVMLIRRISERP